MKSNCNYVLDYGGLTIVHDLDRQELIVHPGNDQPTSHIQSYWEDEDTFLERMEGFVRSSFPDYDYELRNSFEMYKEKRWTCQTMGKSGGR